MIIRIKKTKYDNVLEVFIVQKKVLFIFWKNADETLFYPDYCGDSYNAHYNRFYNKEDAEKYAEQLKRYHTKIVDPKLVETTYLDV